MRERGDKTSQVRQDKNGRGIINLMYIGGELVPRSGQLSMPGLGDATVQETLATCGWQSLTKAWQPTNTQFTPVRGYWMTRAHTPVDKPRPHSNAMRV